jgi:hypothetical protein
MPVYMYQTSYSLVVTAAPADMCLNIGTLW